MATNLFTPILNDRTRAPNFFNGRLLTGEAMTDEQRAHRVAHELLAQAVGDGVAYGLEVEAVPGPLDRPVVRVKSGVAINRRGEVLLLDANTQVQLVRPTEELPESKKIFRTCTPVTSNPIYVADAGIYVLTISSIKAGNGLAQVSGLGDTPASCNIKYIVDAVEFRLLELPVSEETLSDVQRLRNLVAYQCFGVDDLLDFATDPFGTTNGPHTLLDDLSDLTECDVPLALLYWTASEGVQFVDMWAVRRRVAHTKAASVFPPTNDTRLAVAEAMVQQFEAHAADLIKASSTPTTLRARDSFWYLPPAGRVPLSSAGVKGITYQSFFDGRTYNAPRFVNGARLAPFLRNYLTTFPIDFHNNEMLWLYTIVQNVRSANAGGPSSPQQYLVFASGHTPYQADAQYDVSYWNYSNYS